MYFEKTIIIDKFEVSYFAMSCKFSLSCALQIEALQDGIGVEEPKVMETVTKKLERMTAIGTTWPKTGMKPGNLNASIEAIGQLAEIHYKYEEVTTSDEEVSVSIDPLYSPGEFIKIQMLG